MRISIFSMIFLILSCKSNPVSNTIDKEAEKKSSNVPDHMKYKVGLEFIQEYAGNIMMSKETKIEWVNENENLTNEFKTNYLKLVNANNDNPADYDPIVDGNDMPDTMAFDSFDNKSNILVAIGVDWPEYKVAIKLKNVGEKWLVDGCGAVNVEERLRVKK